MKKLTLANPFKKGDTITTQLMVTGAFAIAGVGIIFAVLFVQRTLDAAFTVPQKAFEQTKQGSDLLSPQLLERVRAAQSAKIAPPSPIPDTVADPFTPPVKPPTAAVPASTTPPAPSTPEAPLPSRQ